MKHKDIIKLIQKKHKAYLELQEEAVTKDVIFSEQFYKGAVWAMEDLIESLGKETK